MRWSAFKLELGSVECVGGEFRSYFEEKHPVRFRGFYEADQMERLSAYECVCMCVCARPNTGLYKVCESVCA